MISWGLILMHNVLLRNVLLRNWLRNSERPKEIPKCLGCASFGRIITSANSADGHFDRSLLRNQLSFIL